MLNLDEIQIHFIAKEFDVNEQDLMSISKEKWHSIREKCADIEAEETYEDDYDESITEDDDAYYDCVHCTERGEIAASIVDTPYKMLFS